MPVADTPAMNAQLAETARTVAPFVGEMIPRIISRSSSPHAALVLDGAGGRGGHDSVVPDNISLVVLAPCRPELNPVESWLYLRANWLAKSVFDDYDAIVEACCAAWNHCAHRPDVIASIASRQWAKVS